MKHTLAMKTCPFGWCRPGYTAGARKMLVALAVAVISISGSDGEECLKSWGQPQGREEQLHALDVCRAPGLGHQTLITPLFIYQFFCWATIFSCCCLRNETHAFQLKFPEDKEFCTFDAGLLVCITAVA